MKKTMIKIKGKRMELKNTNRSLLKFEEMTGKNVLDMDNTYTDTLKLFYCVVYGANYKIIDFDFEGFLDILDDDETLTEQFTQYLKRKQVELQDDESDESDKKKVIEI